MDRLYPWRIYYDDGTTFGDLDGTPFDAPTSGALVVAQGAPKAALSHGLTAWYWRDNTWQCCDMVGVWDYLLNHRGPKAIVFGRTVRDENFHRTVIRAGVEGAW